MNAAIANPKKKKKLIPKQISKGRENEKGNLKLPPSLSIILFILKFLFRALFYYYYYYYISILNSSFAATPSKFINTENGLTSSLELFPGNFAFVLSNGKLKFTKEDVKAKKLITAFS